MDTALFLYDRVADNIADRINSGALTPGARAPSLRSLGRQLDVSVATVMQAYDKLERLGYLQARPQSGFYVLPRDQAAVPEPAASTVDCTAQHIRFGRDMNEILASVAREDVLPLSIASPHPSLLPAKALSRALRRVSTGDASAAIPYAPIAGIPALRQAIARRASTLEHPVTSDDIMITNGATEALALCLRTVARPGDVIAVESPTYFSLLQLINSLGMLALEVATDATSGLSASTLEPLIERENVRAVISVGNFNNPTGSLVPSSEKQAIVALLARHRIPLIEDDVYGELHFGSDRPKTYQQFNTEGLVMSCSSFSKTIAPGYRVGWIQSASHHQTLRDLKLIASSATPTLNQMAIAEYLEHGGYDRHLKRLRHACEQQVARTRQAICRHFPAGTRISQPQGGYAIWVQCPPGTDTNQVYHDAIEHNISIAPGSLFSATGQYRSFLRICAGLPWCDEIETAIAKLGTMVAKHATMAGFQPSGPST